MKINESLETQGFFLLRCQLGGFNRNLFCSMMERVIIRPVLWACIIKTELNFTVPSFVRMTGEAVCGYGGTENRLRLPSGCPSENVEEEQYVGTGNSINDDSSANQLAET
ncbi:hypothetical protein IJ21_08090 [Paenibacillus sp. 32O-W]|jgi:hypothetical protein|nr:hypothetical protein IJ21_08090 [Paenibacillus sp. 32O-W]